jgi:hypothetical protein
VGLGVVNHSDRGVLVDQLVHGLAELDVILAILGRHRDSEHRLMRLDLHQRRMRLLARRQCIACPGVFELAERHRFACARGAALVGVVADHLEGCGHAAGFALRRKQRDAVADLAA